MPFEVRNHLDLCVSDYEKLEGQSVLATSSSSEPSLLGSLAVIDLNMAINHFPHRDTF